MNKGNGWTLEHRRAQAQRIHQWRPWEKSTGPKAEQGKATSARNAWKGGQRPALRELARLLRAQRRGLDECRQLDNSF